MMLIGNLSLTGFGLPFIGIGTSGFYSKDGIINAAFLAGTPIGTYAFVLTLSAVLLTSFYSWRQFLMTFHGPYRGEKEQKFAHADADAHGHDEPLTGEDHGHGHSLRLSEVHEPPWTLLAPLAVLAVGALIAGAIFAHDFVGGGANAFWHGTIGAVIGHPAHAGSEVPMWVEVGPLAATLIGFAVAYYYYVLHPDLPPRMAKRGGLVYTFLYNKWYFDELYDILFVRPAFWVGRLFWRGGDERVIDGIGPDGVAARVLDATREAIRLQSGYVYHYAFAMLVGVVALATWFIFTTGGVR
jgi:NADH-quinone oxidoreductase subunit L